MGFSNSPNSSSHNLVETYIFRLRDITLWPMARSDNIYAFANSTTDATKSLSIIAEKFYALGRFQVKDGSTEIAPACTRHFTWPDITVSGLRFTEVDEFVCLGYTMTCDGDVSSQRSRVLGTFRGSLVSASKSLAKTQTSQFYRAKWWRSQLQGLIVYNAAFLGPPQITYSKLETIGNLGARFVGKLSAMYLLGPLLEQIQQKYRIRVAQLFSENNVKWMGHCYRHTDMPVYPFLSRPFGDRLASLRLQGRRTEVSDAKSRCFIICPN